MKMTNKRLLHIALDIYDIIAFLIFVWGIVLFIRFFVASPYTVVGASMEPMFHENDFIIVDKVSPAINGWHRGDIIVFVPPGQDIPYIKRIIGLPGEIVKIDQGDVFICKQSNPSDCMQLDESYLTPGLKTNANATCDGLSTLSVTSGGFVAFGDNRNASTDSRCCFGLWCYEGASYIVPEENIIGKVLIRVFPHITKSFTSL